MVGVALPFRNKGKSGTLPSIRSQGVSGADVQDRSRGRLVQLDGGMIHGPHGRQLELLKGAEKRQMGLNVIGVVL